MRKAEYKKILLIRYSNFYLTIILKKVLHHSLLFLCILNFQYLWNLEKWSDQAQISRECFMYPLLLFL